MSKDASRRFRERYSGLAQLRAQNKDIDGVVYLINSITLPSSAGIEKNERYIWHLVKKEPQARDVTRGPSPPRNFQNLISASNSEKTKKQKQDSTLETISQDDSDSSEDEVNLFAESPEPEIIAVDVHRTSDGDIVNNAIQEAQNQDNFDFLETQPKQTSTVKEPLHEQLVLRWSSYIQDGIEKEQKEKIIEKYPLFENCPLLKTPELGPELESCLDAKTQRQDKFMAHLQNETRHALAALGSQINKLLASGANTKKKQLPFWRMQPN
nr:unnamed protein product [Callosobruchus analis]